MAISNKSALAGLAAALAHELNTPLGALSVALECAEERLENPELVGKYLRLARQASERAATVISTLSSWTGHTGPVNGDESLQNVVVEALAAFSLEAECAAA